MKIISILILITLFITPIFSKNSAAYIIMERVHQQAQLHKNQKASMTLKIYDKKNRERKRVFYIWKKKKKNKTKSLIKFHKPRSVNKTALLTKSESGNIYQWLYLPALKSVKRISSSDKHKSFMGSDFTFQDISGRDIDQDSHTLLNETNETYIIESIPKDKLSIYSKLIYTINKNTLVPSKIQFFDTKDRLFKELNNTNIKEIQGMFITTLSTMKNKKTKGKSTLHIDTFTIEKSLDDQLFDIRGLKQ